LFCLKIDRFFVFEQELLCYDRSALWRRKHGKSVFIDK
jgi:hypothetical protein